MIWSSGKKWLGNNVTKTAQAGGPCPSLKNTSTPPQRVICRETRDAAAKLINAWLDSTEPAGQTKLDLPAWLTPRVEAVRVEGVRVEGVRMEAVRVVIGASSPSLVSSSQAQRF